MFPQIFGYISDISMVTAFMEKKTNKVFVVFFFPTTNIKYIKSIALFSLSGAISNS